MKILFVVVLIMLSVVSAAFADIELPDPEKKGGIGIFDALEARASARGGSFPSGKPDNKELSQILWAATGLNRGGNGWTVPLAMGMKPYCKIYAAGSEGVFLYDWQNNKLIEISKKDIRPNIVSQEFAKTVPYSLIFVTDSEVLGNRDKETSYHFASVAAGAMTQNVYLAAASMNLGARYIYSIDRAFIHGELKLPKDDSAICVLLVGKYAL